MHRSRRIVVGSFARTRGWGTWFRGGAYTAFLTLCLLIAPAQGQNVLFRLDSLPSCTLEEGLNAELAAAFHEAATSPDKVEALADGLSAKKDPAGDFMLGWAAEHPPAGQRPDLLKAAQHYRAGAAASHPACQVNLATLLMRGSASHPEAGDLLRAALARLPAQAGFFLGIHSLSTATSQPEAETALAHWEMAGKAGSARAWRHLGMAHEGLLGLTGLKKSAAAARAYQEAVKLDDHEARVRLGALLLSEKQLSEGLKADSPDQLFKTVRESSQPDALFLLGQILEQSFPNRKTDLKAAEDVYQKAAVLLGHPPAMVRLGLLAAEKAGKPFPPEALAWYERAASVGHGPALHQLALFSTSQPEGAQEAFRRFLAAALAGYAPSTSRLANAYRLGIGTPVDPHAAAVWFARAIEAGDTEAMVSIAEMMLGSEGVPYDEQLLNHLTQRALSAGNPRAGFLIGMMYSRGIGKEKNYVLALAHLSWSAKKGVTQTTTLAEVLSTKMSETQIEEARRIEATLPDHALPP